MKRLFDQIIRRSDIDHLPAAKFFVKEWPLKCCTAGELATWLNGTRHADRRQEVFCADGNGGAWCQAQFAADLCTRKGGPPLPKYDDDDDDVVE